MRQPPTSNNIFRSVISIVQRVNQERGILGEQASETGKVSSGAHSAFTRTCGEKLARYRGVFGGRRVLFLNPLDMEARNLRAGQIVDIL